MKQRIVFDTSTLVGAALRSKSVPDRALMKALDWYDLCVCAELLAELERILAKKEFARYASAEARQAFVAFLKQNGWMFAVSEQDLANVKPRCRDAKDDFILALATVSKADAIVSSDYDLLVLNPRRDIPILTPAQFVAQFSR